MPGPVADEILRRGEQDVTAQAIQNTAWLITRAVPDIPAAILTWRLGAGESGALTLAAAHGLEVIIDDLAGRQCAASLNIPVRGTLGLVLAAKQRGKIPKARPIIEDMMAAGLHLSRRVLDQALRRVEERAFVSEIPSRRASPPRWRQHAGSHRVSLLCTETGPVCRRHRDTRVRYDRRAAPARPPARAASGGDFVAVHTTDPCSRRRWRARIAATVDSAGTTADGAGTMVDRVAAANARRSARARPRRSSLQSPAVKERRRSH